MRKAKREIKDYNELIHVLNQCQVCRIALNDIDGVPYILPLNYGMSEKDGKIRPYFHSALEGKKLDLIKEDARAGCEMDCKGQLQYFEDRGYCTYAYESIIGKGVIKILSDEEKFDALTILMDHYHPGQNAYFNPAAMSRTTVYVLDVTKITGKRKEPK